MSSAAVVISAIIVDKEQILRKKLIPINSAVGDVLPVRLDSC